MKASIQLTMEQPTMFRWLPSTLFGLLLIFLMVACTPATTTDDSALSDENLEIATDSSTDSPDQASTEPPAATLTIDGQEQNAGITGDCWQQGDGTSICADGIGFTTPPDPIQAESTILAQFEFILDAKLERVQLSIFPASQPVLMGPNESDWRYWKTEGELPDTNRGVLLEEITAEDRIIYLPVQPPSGASMAALNERTLVEVDGCLRIDNGHYAGGWLVLWPYGSDIQVTDNSIEVINEDGKPVGRVGEWMRAGGGAVENSHGMAGIDEMIPGMPIDGCPGPYWVAAPFETMDEQSVPDIYFQPFSDNDQILAWFVNQSRPSPETQVLSGELKLDAAGCLRLEEYLLILPPETYLREDPLRIVDRGLDEIAQIGDSIQVTGAEKHADDYRYFNNKVRCAGPYWGGNQISTNE